MAASSNTARLQVGSAAWVSDERVSASQLADSEVEEFTFSARNELEWLNEHMREIFNENQLSVAEMFKTPGKLRGKTPRTIRRNPLEMRAPLTDIFSASPRNAASTPQAKVFREKAQPTFTISKDVASSPAPEATQSERISPEKSASPTRKPAPSRIAAPALYDSGYHGSQGMSQQATQENTQPFSQSLSPERPPPLEAQHRDVEDHSDDQRPVTADSAYTAETHQTDEEELQAQLQAEASITHESPAPTPAGKSVKHISSPVNWTPATAHTLKHASPEKSSPFRSSPQKSDHDPMDVEQEHDDAPESERKPAEVFDQADTPSDGSSPVRQVIRKSSLSFASLPQREPLTVKKSIGQRNSRGSHFDPSRSSYFGNARDGKSFGGQRAKEAHEDHDELDLDDSENSAKRSSKTYTQRLQDQINLLGQVKTTQSRLSKSITNLAASSASQQLTYPILPQEEEEHITSSPIRHERSFAAPGAYPEEEDSWIGGPPTASIPVNKALSPRQHLAKSHSVDFMEDVLGNGGSIAGREFKVPQREPRQPSPMVEKPISAVPDRARALGHLKSQSTTSFQSPQRKDEIRGFETLKKTISVENPHRDGHDQDYHYSPSKSPAHSLRGSPLKAAKDKLSSILKTSKGLFASSAAVSADAKMAAAASVGSPSASRDVSREERALRDAENEERPITSLYPALSNPYENQNRIPDSPSKKNSIRKLKEKEAKEARVMAEQLTKLDIERAKEAEKARVFSQQERERVASMERKVAAQRESAKQDEERRAAMQREEERREAERREALRLEEERAAEEEEQRKIAMEREAERKAASTPSLLRPTRSSPRKTKAQLEAEGRDAAAKRAEEIDIDNADAQMMPPPSTVGRSQIARPKSAAANRLQRPTSKQAAPAARGAPVVIRVNTGSRPFQPSTAALSASLSDSLPSAPAPNPAPPPARAGRPATKAIVPKASNESLKAAASNTSKVRALESAARKREQEEREVQNKRDAKVAMTQQLEAKRNAQKALERKQEIEKAKERRPPPPPARPNPHADRDKPLPAPPVNQRINQDLQRPLQDRNEAYQTAKAPPKRPLAGEENQRPGIPRNGPSYQQQPDAKRRKTEDEYDFDMPSPPRGAAAPPIRQSSIRKQVSQTSVRAPSHPPRTAPVHISDLNKDAPMKSLFPSGYTAAQSEGVRHIPNAIPQHMQQKPLRPAENKAAPPHGFGTNAASKTPARAMGPAPNGKSTSKRSAKDSPKYVNGENIDLPEINTDSEDSGSDAGGEFNVPEWAASPNLAAGIIAQEGRDPLSVFGPPGELKMEEVFRNKERWGRFRQRTSSANWSGQDRLTEEEVKRDLEMRERLRREGGWSYGMS